MSKRFLIATAAALTVAGACYAAFWQAAIREAGTLGSTAPAAPNESFEDNYPFFSRALSILGVDLFAPSVEQNPTDPAALARRISRGMWTHRAAGVLIFLVGVLLILAAVAGTSKRKTIGRKVP